MLDVDHRAMGDLIDFIANRFGPNVRRDTQSAPELQHWLYVLGDRTRAHFSREEALMTATGYPELLEHQREHTLMLAEYTALVRDVVARGTSRLQPEDLASIKDWFLGHLLYMDKRLAHFLSTSGARASH
jgi:hemerythrin